MNIRFSQPLLGAAVGALALAASSIGAPAQEVTLRLQTFVPPVSNPVKTFLIPWADKVEADSGGRIKIERFWSMQLGGTAPQLIDQVKDGVVDIGWVVPGFTAGRMPLAEVFELPFIHRDAVSTTLAMQDFQDKHLADEQKDFKVLLMHVHAGNLFMSKGPIQSVDDLSQLTIRAPSRTGVWFLEALGATPIGAPLGEIPSLMSRGTIDGVTLPYEISPAVQMQELANYFTELEGDSPRFSTTVFAFLMNKDSYESLPDDLKQVIDDNSGRNIAEMAGRNWIEIESAKAVMEAEEKNRFQTIPASEVAKMREAAERVYARWVEEVNQLGVDGEALLADAMALVEQYSQ